MYLNTSNFCQIDIELGALLSCYNTYDQGDIYFEISKAILENYNNLDMSNLQACADYLHISVSSLNRFIKQIYYNGFSDFRNCMSLSEENYHYDGKYLPMINERVISPIEFGKLLCDRITEAMQDLSQEKLESLVSMIKDSKEIIFVGIQLTSEVWRLQRELIFMGKRTSAFLDPNYQVSEVSHTGSDSLVICMQYNRQQDNHNESLMKEAKNRGAKTAFIGNIKIKGIEQNSDISIVYKGTNTNVDTHIAHIILNYIGNYLRVYLMAK